MAFQVRVGSLIVIARSRSDAIRLLERLSEGRSFDDVRVCDMNGKQVDVDRLRAGLDKATECEN
jgi:hypothetical protein